LSDRWVGLWDGFRNGRGRLRKFWGRLRKFWGRLRKLRGRLSQRRGKQPVANRRRQPSSETL
jgi:hypothetical protein